MKDKSKLITAGRPTARGFHPVNPVVERASTILFSSYENYVEGARSIAYGRLGTSTHRALEEAVTALEGGYETRLASSGLQACNIALLAFCEAGDHVLVADCVYDPTRKFCENFLKRYGVETTFFDPLATPSEIKELMRENTKVVFAESPGSLTFEVQDIPALARIAHDVGAMLVVDNTWAAGLYCKPIALGADVSIQAATKYLAGHSDCLVGTITSADETIAKKVFYGILQLGVNVSADDAYLTLRGMRTLAARLRQHEETGLTLAKWLNKRADVERVIHPGLKGAPGHDIWKRDFTGASGLFGMIIAPVSQPALEAFFDTLRVFGIGFSWGGFESLCLHTRPAQHRTASTWNEKGHLIRIHAGLEDIDDLKADLENAFAAMAMVEANKGQDG